MSQLLEPKTIPLMLANGKTKNFNLGKFPAVTGREILVKYPISNTPKLADYGVSEATMLKLMSHVEVITENGPVRLSTVDLVNNHTDVGVLMKLEWAMLEYNFDFLKGVLNSGSFGQSAQKILEGTLKTLITSLAPLLQAVKQRSGN